jgi:hypothetical protein
VCKHLFAAGKAADVTSIEIKRPNAIAKQGNHGKKLGVVR